MNMRIVLSTVVLSILLASCGLGGDADDQKEPKKPELVETAAPHDAGVIDASVANGIGTSPSAH